ncbi:hypothetical protein C8R43DRAFT_1021706 [Mycena crocata]|nr:hypothetical protein C8R43DRAFT_1021706 [Mycena crocata]
MLESGNPHFFPALVAHIQELAPSLPLDPVVFQAILLCLISGEKHLLLRAAEQDVRLVSKLAFLILSSVFGLPTHKLKIRPRSAHPAQTSGGNFLRSLFLPWTASVDSQDETLPAKSTGSSRNRTRNNATWTRSSTKKPRRNPNPNELLGGTTTSNPFGDSHEFLPSTSSSVVNPFSTAPKPPKARAPLPHTFSDPTPIRPRSIGLFNLQPRALVVSGLEYAALPSQRALSRALAEKRVVLDGEDGDDGYDDEVWNLPDNFMMVYVCAIDARERPAIHKSLLDKFAMSATVAPHHSLRALLLSPSRNSASYRNSPAINTSPLPQGQSTPTSSLPFLGQPIPLPHHSHSLPLPHSLHHHHMHNPLPQQPLVPPALLYDLRASYDSTHLSPLLSLYASDLFSAARHHPQLDAMLLTAKSMKDVIDLARASRVIGGDLTGIELVREDAADAAAKTHKTGNGNGHGNSHAKREGDLDGESDATTPVITGNKLAHRYQPTEVVVEEMDGESTPPGAGDSPAQSIRLLEPEVLEVSQADIARIAPRVMTHRLRVRDGPQDEVLASAMFPAVPSPGDDDGIAPEGANLITIKEILVTILAQV